MNVHWRQLLKGTSIMSIAGILQQGVGFFLLPLYTRYLTPADYGAVELFFILTLILDTIVHQGMSSAVMKRIAYDHNEDNIEGRKVAIGTALLYVGCSALVTGVLICLIAQPLSNMLFEEKGHDFLVVIAAVTLFCESGFKIAMVPLRADQKYTLVGVISFFVFLGRLTGNLLFLLYFKAGFSSLVYGWATGSVIGICLTTFSARHYVAWAFDRREFQILTKFGWPLIWSAIGFMVLSSTDRILLKNFGGSADVGLYAIAAKFGMVFETALLSPFRKTWPTVYYKIAKLDDAKQRFANFALRFFSFGLIAALGAHFFSPYLITLMTTPEFYQSATVVGLLMLGRFLYSLNDILKVGMNIECKTHLLPVRVVIAAILNIIIDLLLIPKFGIIGAALGTAVSFGFMDIYTIRACRYFYHVNYDWGRIFILTAIATCLLIIQLILPDFDMLVDMAAKLSIFLIFFVLSAKTVNVNLFELLKGRI